MNARSVSLTDTWHLGWGRGSPVHCAEGAEIRRYDSTSAEKPTLCGKGAGRGPRCCGGAETRDSQPLHMKFRGRAHVCFCCFSTTASMLPSNSTHAFFQGHLFPLGLICEAIIRGSLPLTQVAWGQCYKALHNPFPLRKQDEEPKCSRSLFNSGVAA